MKNWIPLLSAIFSGGALIFAVILIIIIFAVPDEDNTNRDEQALSEEGDGDFEEEQDCPTCIRVRYHDNRKIFLLPEEITFGGETVPRGDFWIEDLLQSEWLSMLEGNLRDDVLLWIKRSSLYFPVAEKVLEEYGVPDEFKYLLAAESSFVPKAASDFAKGIAQFTPDTAAGMPYEAYLPDENYWDSRADPELCIRAMAFYLKSLYYGNEENDIPGFGNWLITLGAYNMGPGSMSSTMREQNSFNPFDLYMFSETKKYITRIIIIKLVFENYKEIYGIREEDRFSYPPYRKIILATYERTDINLLCDLLDVSFRWMTEMNPGIDVRLGKNDRNRFHAFIPAGYHPIRIPEDKVEQLEDSLESIDPGLRQTFSGETVAKDVKDIYVLWEIQHGQRIYDVGEWVKNNYFMNQDNPDVKGNAKIYFFEEGTTFIVKR